MALTTISRESVGGVAMTTAVRHRVAMKIRVIAEIPACAARGVAPKARLAIRVATEVVEAKTKIRVVVGSSAVLVWRLTCPHLALRPVARCGQAASVVPAVATSVRLVAHVPPGLAELPA